MSFETSHILHTCFIECELYVIHEWATTWFPATVIYINDLPGAIYMRYPTGLSKYTCMVARCELPGTWYISNFIAYQRIFSGGALWATDEQNCDLSDVWKTTTQTNTNVYHYIRFNIDWVKTFGIQTDHQSALRWRGTFIFRYFDVFGPVSVLMYYIYSCILGTTHHGIALFNCQLSVP